MVVLTEKAFSFDYFKLEELHEEYGGVTCRAGTISAGHSTFRMDTDSYPSSRQTKECVRVPKLCAVAILFINLNYTSRIIIHR
jgi:hypothetical protein